MRRQHPAVESAINNFGRRDLDEVLAQGAQGFARAFALSGVAASKPTADPQARRKTKPGIAEWRRFSGGHYLCCAIADYARRFRDQDAGRLRCLTRVSRNQYSGWPDAGRPCRELGKGLPAHGSMTATPAS